MGRRTLVALVASVTLLAGCGFLRDDPTLEGVPDASTTSVPAPADPTSSSTAATTAPAAPPLTWRRCGSDDCATLDVPLDHAQPGGARLGMAIARRAAKDPGARIGSLVFNPGGPGASGVESLGFLYDRLPDAVKRRFDVVGFDPRGVGASQPVRCLSGPELDAYFHADPLPDDDAEEQRLVEASKRFVAGCEAKSGSLLPHLATVDVARDLDLLRAALGDERLTYVGFSYGTQIGATYGRLFPARVRALVLDGAVDPLLTANENNAQQGVGFDRALGSFLADCRSRGGACAWKPQGGATVAAFDRLMDRIDAAEIAGAGGRRVGPSEALLGAAQALYSQASWSTLAQGLQRAEGGDGGVLLTLFDQLVDRKSNGTYGNLQEVFNAVSCLDRPRPASVEEVERAAQAAGASAPVYGPVIVWSGLVCALWPVAPKPFPAPAGPLAPVLVIGTTNDPATPYEAAQALAALLEARLLTYRGEGHTVYGQNGCVDRLTNAYLIDGTLPPAGATC